MLIDAFLSGLVVVGTDAQDRVHSVHFERTDGLHDLGRIVPPHTKYHRNAVAHETDRLCEQFLLLGVGQRNTFAGGTHGHHIIHSAHDLMVDKLLQTCIIDLSVGAEGGYQSDPEAAKSFVHRSCRIPA